MKIILKFLRKRYRYDTDLEAFIINMYGLESLIDPNIKRIKFNIKEKLSHDLIAFIYVRFAHNLNNFPV